MSRKRSRRTSNGLNKQSSHLQTTLKNRLRFATLQQLELRLAPAVLAISPSLLPDGQPGTLLAAIHEADANADQTNTILMVPWKLRSFRREPADRERNQRGDRRQDPGHRRARIGYFGCRWPAALRSCQPGRVEHQPGVDEHDGSAILAIRRRGDAFDWRWKRHPARRLHVRQQRHGDAVRRSLERQHDGGRWRGRSERCRQLPAGSGGDGENIEGGPSTWVAAR